MYKIEYSHTAAKAIKKAPTDIAKRLLTAIEELAAAPYEMTGVKKLTGREGYRLRVGDWRILYTIHDNILTICILNAGNRKGIYK
ncbi:type II toxin-antitoxin system RelE/ParE family toxin [uncultured Bilophila sp.]|uniref:type II toxin-antitoxin system RelE family toxin n=1 Tax=uncultured Bilophila sp. TaxID=529385 RepID=UPI00266FF1CE|nr:type II toxin-antitoxin system RelE/ParE family toxin [uncultured Bilophila sp.]